MKKINVLYIVWGLSYGGAERFILNVIKNIDKKKYNVVVFSDSQNKGEMQDDYEENGAKVIYSKYHRFKHPVKFIKQIKEIIKNEKIDIIHANDDYNMIFALLANKKKALFISHSHNTKFRFTQIKALSFIASVIIPHYITKKADIRVACGYDAGKALYKNNNFTVIQNGLEYNKYKYSDRKRELIRRQYGIADDCVVWLNIGRLDKQKNQLFLVDVFNEYQKSALNALLIIIGDGAERQNIKQRIEEYGIGDKILLLPARKDAYEYYNAADLFIMTSVHEGMPMVSIESQINGLVCVFSDSISKESDHTGNTIFLPLREGSKRWSDIICNTDVSRKQCDYNKVKNYDIKNVAKRMENIYRKAVAKKGI